jgi:alpha-galactosidase
VAQGDLKLEKAQCLEGGLSGADFVVLSISTGGLDATALELEIPAHYGLVQTVGDTVGPGDLFRGLRNIPAVVVIARPMEEYCPDTVLLNLTNPLTVLTRAVSKATSIRAVGLCHELFSTLGMLSKMFDVTEEAINARVAGINHFIWVTDLSVHGRDVTEEAFRRITAGRSREEISDIMAAMWRSGEDSVNIVNLPNAGQVRDLPLGAVVEAYGAFNGTGA